MSNEPYHQLVMDWPQAPLRPAPEVSPPPRYALRLYQPDDESRFCEMMALVGWPGWDEERLRPWRARIPPECWFVAVHEGSGLIVASAMGLHDPTDWHPAGGELGWVASDPAHAGQGLGRVVSAAVTARLLELGYRQIHLYTEHWRLAAIKTYLRLGYLPRLHLPEMAERWRVVCKQLGWPFEPERWPG